MRNRLHDSTTGEREPTTGTTIARENPAARARGGLSLLSVLTGLAVAAGAMVVMAIGLGAGFYLLDRTDLLEVPTDTTQLAVGGVALVIAVQFISYLWGGYTAGRMARSSGLLHGLLVPMVALLGVVAVFAIGDARGTGAQVSFGSFDGRIPFDRDVVVNAGMALGIGSLAAMLVGGLLGGLTGGRWHRRLEDRELTNVMVEDRVRPATPGHFDGDAEVEGVRVLEQEKDIHEIPVVADAGMVTGRTIDLRERSLRGGRGRPSRRPRQHRLVPRDALIATTSPY